jgi:signal transduction histidine kinase
VLRARTLDDLVAHLTRCQEQERAELSVRLHDQVGGLLTALKLEIEGIARNGGHETADWNRVEIVFQRLYDEVRGLSSLLYPRMIGTMGLKSAMEEMVARLHSGPVEIRLEVDEPVAGLDSESGLCVLRIVQEAIVNVGRHAGAGMIAITLQYTEGTLIGTVDDDGRGWCGDDEGMGLTLMRERVRKLGGELVLGASPQGGARVRFAIPGKLAG